MEKKYKIEVSIAEIETIIQALEQQNYIIKSQVIDELKKQLDIVKDKETFIKRFDDIMETCVSYQLESEMKELLNAIYEVAI